jgi:hypothetical protein
MEHDDPTPDDVTPEDTALLTELRSALDAAPADVIEQGCQAFTWRRIDEELAMLSEESELTGVRSAAVNTAVTFAAGELMVEIEVQTDGSRRSVIGQIIPAGPATIEADGPDQPVAGADTNQFGMFELSGLRPGPLRLRVVAADGTRVVTDWLLI